MFDLQLELGTKKAKIEKLKIKITALKEVEIREAN